MNASDTNTLRAMHHELVTTNRLLDQLVRAVKRLGDPPPDLIAKTIGAPSTQDLPPWHDAPGITAKKY